MDLSEEITCNAGNLHASFIKACATSPHKATTKAFAANELAEIARAQEELHARSWSISPMIPFRLTERGRTREIRGNRPYDRMVLHSYLDCSLGPLLTRKLIYDNYASQPGKGTALARQRFEMFLRECFRKYGTNDFLVLLTDLSKFYDNVEHERLKNAILSDIDYESFHEYMIDQILKSFRVDVSYLSDDAYKACLTQKYSALEHAQIPKALLTGEKFMDKSIDIGNHASQIFSIYYPTKADIFVKVVNSIRPYGRYMDDSFTMSDSRMQLTDLLGALTEIYDRLGLFVNEKKTHIVHACHDFKWLGRIYRVTESGKILMRPQKEIITRERRKLTKYADMLDDGTLRFDFIYNQFSAWKGVFYPIMSREQCQSMDDHYNNLFIKKWRRGDYDV